MAVSKSIRFEVFARDSFTCQYCGKRPPEVILEVDHIHPVSKGGLDDLTNLLASCYDCNRGKRARIISDVAPRPDADLMFLRVQQELAEAKRYHAAKKKRDNALAEVRECLIQTWQEMLAGAEPPPVANWNQWVNKYGPEEVELAINKCSVKAQYSDLGRGSPWVRCTECSKYISGILKKRMGDANAE